MKRTWIFLIIVFACTGCSSDAPSTDSCTNTYSDDCYSSMTEERFTKKDYPFLKSDLTISRTEYVVYYNNAEDSLLILKNTKGEIKSFGSERFARIRVKEIDTLQPFLQRKKQLSAYYQNKLQIEPVLYDVDGGTYFYKEISFAVYTEDTSTVANYLKGYCYSITRRPFVIIQNDVRVYSYTVTLNDKISSCQLCSIANQLQKRFKLTSITQFHFNF